MMSAIFFSATFLGWPKKLLCNVAPLRCRVARVRADGCARAALLLRPSPDPCFDQEVSQVKRSLASTCPRTLPGSSQHQAQRCCCDTGWAGRHRERCGIVAPRLFMISWQTVSASWTILSLLFATLPLTTPSNGLASFICLYLGCTRLSAFEVTSVWHPSTDSRILVSSIRGSGRPGGALKGLASSTSVSSYSQDSVGVSPGFHFFDDHPSRRLCESQSLKRFFNFLVVLLSCSFAFSFHHHGSIHGTVQRFCVHHCNMLYHAWALN